jgi:ribosome-associated translation inhibitor RaiA
MRLQIRSQSLAIDQDLRDAIERRLRFVLGRYGGKLGRVTVYLANLTYPHGGAGFHCRILVRLLRSGRFSMEDTDPDLGAVVNRTMDRMGQAVRREMERQHEESGRRSASTRQ